MRLRLFDTLLDLTLRLAAALDFRDRRSESLSPAAVRSVLLLSSTALGDAVVSSAAFGPVRRRFPQARIVALIHAAYVPLFEQHAEIDAVVPFYGGWRRFVSTILRLRRARPEVALVLHGNEPQATPLAYLSGARVVVKFPNRSPFHFLLSNREPAVLWKDMGHGLNQRLRVAAAVGADVAGARMSLPETAAAAQEADAFLAAAELTGRTLIGFQCGASGRSRMWPAQKFVELGQLLIAAVPGCGIVLTGSPAERAWLDDIAAQIRAGAAAGTVAVAAGTLSLPALPALLRRLRLLVTGDTGTMHVAFAVATPTVCLFAVSDPATSGPAYDLERHCVIHRPCADLSVSTKSDDQACIARIAVDEVCDAVLARLSRSPA